MKILSEQERAEIYPLSLSATEKACIKQALLQRLAQSGFNGLHEYLVDLRTIKDYPEET